MARSGRLLLRVAGIACLVVGLFPSEWGASHPLNDGTTGGTYLGLPSSPVYRSSRRTVELPDSTTTSEDGRRFESSRLSSTVWSWEIRIFSWSAALVASGAVLLVVSLRPRVHGSPRSGPPTA